MENLDNWKFGEITIRGTAYTYSAKVYNTGSACGVNGGRVSKLTIKENGKTVANYDRGWDIKPGALTNARKATRQVLKLYS